MTQLSVTTEIISNMMQHYMLSASSCTVHATRCQARILSADNKTRCPIWLMQLPLFAKLGTKPSKRCHVVNVFISDRLKNFEIAGDYLQLYS